MTRRAPTRTSQNRPNRRYRRLLPVAVIGATVAAGLPLAAPAPGHAETHPRIQGAPPPALKATVPRASRAEPRPHGVS